MQTETHVTVIADVIRLAVAPVFLLSGIGAMLAVMTNRLGRVIDRARELESRFASLQEREQTEAQENLLRLSRRARLINIAITLCTTCALLVCTVIVALFVGAFLSIDLAGLIGVVFIAAMLSLIGGLVSFLREIYISTRSLRIGPK
jgi:hypothetical protein